MDSRIHTVQYYQYSTTSTTTGLLLVATGPGNPRQGRAQRNRNGALTGLGMLGTSQGQGHDEGHGTLAAADSKLRGRARDQICCSLPRTVGDPDGPERDTLLLRRTTTKVLPRSSALRGGMYPGRRLERATGEDTTGYVQYRIQDTGHRTLPAGPLVDGEGRSSRVQ